MLQTSVLFINFARSKKYNLRDVFFIKFFNHVKVIQNHKNANIN